MSEQSKNGRVLAFYELRLRNLVVERAEIHMSCRWCGHKSVIGPLDLIRRLGPDASVRHLGRAMRCTKCNGLGHAFIELDWKTPRWEPE